MQAPKVIAEIGCNHKGDLAVAKELVVLAKASGCDVAKFQKRCPSELLTPAQYASPHPNQSHAYGDTYGAHREALELSAEEHAEPRKAAGTSIETSSIALPEGRRGEGPVLDETDL